MVHHAQEIIHCVRCVQRGTSHKGELGLWLGWVKVETHPAPCPERITKLKTHYSKWRRLCVRHVSAPPLKI
jgi:hypothetical protein